MKKLIKTTRFIIYILLIAVFIFSCAAQNNMYRVAFKGENGYVGYGKWQSDSTLVQEWVDYENNRYPSMLHWVDKK